MYKFHAIGWLKHSEEDVFAEGCTGKGLVEEIDPHNLDDVQRITGEMADFIGNMVEEMQEAMGFHIEASMFADMLNASLRDIDYHDIARSELSDALANKAKGE